MRDGSGSIAFVRTNAQAGAGRDAARAAAEQLAGYLNALSDAVVESIETRYVLVNTETAAPGSAPAAHAALLVFSGSEPDSWCTLSIPALSPAFLAPAGAGAGVLINQDDPAVAALVSALIAGDYCNPFAVQLAALEAAYLHVLP